MGTACFERPLIDWIYKTDNPDLVESHLHAHFQAAVAVDQSRPREGVVPHCARRGVAVLRDMEKAREGLCGLRALTPLCWSGRRSDPACLERAVHSS